MVAAIDRQTALERTFAAAFAALDDTKDPRVVAHLYEFIVKHVRSAQPMALLGAADVIEPVSEVVVRTATDATLTVTRNEDDTLTMHLLESSGQDAACTLTASQAEEVRVGLAKVLASGGVR